MQRIRKLQRQRVLARRQLHLALSLPLQIHQAAGVRAAAGAVTLRVAGAPQAGRTLSGPPCLSVVQVLLVERELRPRLGGLEVHQQVMVAGALLKPLSRRLDDEPLDAELGGAGRAE